MFQQFLLCAQCLDIMSDFSVKLHKMGTECSQKLLRTQFFHTRSPLAALLSCCFDLFSPLSVCEGIANIQESCTQPPVITQYHVPNQILIDCAGNFFVCQFSVPHRVYWPGCIVQFYLVLCHAVYKITAMRGFSQELPCLQQMTHIQFSLEKAKKCLKNQSY